MRRLFRNRHDQRPLVGVVITPNAITHQYRIYEPNMPITDTPHFELLGRDLDHIFHYPGMDEATQLLYSSVKALDERISSLSIEPYEMSVAGPEYVNRSRNVRGDWPRGLDACIVDCLARHMGWKDGAQFSIRRQSDSELMAKVDGLIAEEVRRGVDPPNGWPYRNR